MGLGLMVMSRVGVIVAVGVDLRFGLGSVMRRCPVYGLGWRSIT